MTSTLFPSKPRRLTVSSVISDTSAMLRAHFKLFFGLVLFAYLPFSILSSLLPEELPFFAKLLFTSLNHTFRFLSLAAASFAVLHILQGRDTGIRSSLSEAMNRLAPLFALALMMMVISTSASYANAYLNDILASASASRDAGAALAFAGIHLLLAVGTIFLICALSVLVPVCAVEGLYPIGSIKRSFALTRGYRRMFLGLMFVYLLAFACLMLIYSLLLKSFFLPFPFLEHLIREVFVFSQEVILCPLLPIAYYRLIEIKEGTTPVVR